MPSACVGMHEPVKSTRDCAPGWHPMSLVAKVLRRLAAFMLFGIGSAAIAQGYPARSITMVVPFPAGGPSDLVARIVGDQMSKTLGRPIVVENSAGGGGTAATTRVMRAPADGYTIELGNMGTHAAAVALDPKLAYHPATDFEPIGLSAGMPVAIFARKTLPAKNLKEFVTYAKANSNTLSMAHAGVGSVSFGTCLLLNSMLDVKPKLVAYNGTRPAMSALAASQIDYMCDQVANGVTEFARGMVRALAVAGATATPVLPGVPTTREAGLPGFEVAAWNALFAPKGTPKPVLDKLTDALDKALSHEATRKRLHDIGCDIPDGSRRGQQALASLVNSEVERWHRVLGAVGSQSGTRPGSKAGDLK